MDTPQNPAQAIARRAPTAVDKVRAHLESPAFLDQIKMAMPSGEDGRRLVRGAITALQKSPSLAECSQQSIFSSLLTCAQLGLILDGREAHLVKFGQDCILVPDYKGIVRLVMQSGSVEHVHADVVCENDEFEYDMGEVRCHRINLRRPRGVPYAVYALARFRGGGSKAEVLPVEEVERIRARSRNKAAGPWVNDWNEMAKKTAFKRLSKWLPLQSVAREAIDAISVEEDNDPAAAVTEPPQNKLRPRKAPPTVDTTATTVGPAEGTEPEPPPQDNPPTEPEPTAPAPEPPAPARVPRGRKPVTAAEAQAHPIGAWAVVNGITFDQFLDAAIEYGAVDEDQRGKIKGFHDFGADVTAWWDGAKEALAAALKG